MNLKQGIEVIPEGYGVNLLIDANRDFHYVTSKIPVDYTECRKKIPQSIRNFPKIIKHARYEYELGGLLPVEPQSVGAPPIRTPIRGNQPKCNRAK
jgi:hypothetical protein